MTLHGEALERTLMGMPHCCRFCFREVVIGFQGLAAGLSHIHSKGFVDQDLFPGNVLQTADGSACVKADFGNAAALMVNDRPNKIRWCM